MFRHLCYNTSCFRVLARHVVVASLLVWTSTVYANKPKNIEEWEMTLIPAYCPDTMGFKYGDAYSNTSPKAHHWVSLMGRDFWHMHHYCWARINLNRATKSGVSPRAKKWLLENVRNDYRYVINNTQKSFIMLPEIYTRLGEVELLLGKPNKANEAFARARNQKPDYWPAYSHWAEYLLKNGQRQEALKVVTAGLAYSPDSKVLLEIFNVLGGKPADIPAPIKKAPPPPINENETEMSEPPSTEGKTKEENVVPE